MDLDDETSTTDSGDDRDDLQRPADADIGSDGEALAMYE